MYISPIIQIYNTSKIKILQVNHQLSMEVSKEMKKDTLINFLKKDLPSDVVIKKVTSKNLVKKASKVYRGGERIRRQQKKIMIITFNKDVSEINFEKK